jgi:hypothetical protein
MRLLPGIRSGIRGGACRARPTARDPTYEPNARVSSWVPMFMLIWFSPSSFIYETSYGGAEKSPAGRSVVRLSTLAQALAFGKKLEAGVGRPGGFSYSVGPTTPILLALALTLTLTFPHPRPRPKQVYKMEDSSLRLKGTYPKGVNAQDARIKFRKRKPKLGGADEALLGVGGSEWPPLEHATHRRSALQIG